MTTHRRSRAARTAAAAWALLLLAAAAPAGCKDKQQADKQKDARSEPVPVQVLGLSPQTITRVLRYDADVEGTLEVKVFSLVTDRILSIKVEEGDQVKQGQVLAVVRADILSDGLRSARAAIAAAHADRDNLRRELARQEKLLARNVVAQAQVDQMKSQLLGAEAQIARLEALAGQANIQKENALVRAPISGVVAERFLEPGDLCAPTLPVFKIVQMDRVELKLDVPERDLGTIREGMRSSVSVDRFPGRAFEGRVSRISPTIDRLTRTARVEVSIDNLKHELMPGMLARVQLEVERHEGVVVVPYSALVITMGPAGQAVYRAYVAAGGKALERSVEVGIMDGSRVEATSGLAAGEELVTRGQHLLEPGKALRLAERLSPDGTVAPLPAAAEKAAAPAAGGEAGAAPAERAP